MKCGSVSIGDSEIDGKARRWGRMNEMADRRRPLLKKERDFAAKLQALSTEAQKQKEQQDAQEKAKAERLRLCHMGYREHSNFMIAKQKEDDEKRRQDALMRLKLANQRKFTGTLLPSNALYSGDVDVVSFSTGQVPESGMPLFDGQIKPFGAANPISDYFLRGAPCAIFKNSPMARSQFKVYEKHVSAEGKPFFISG